MFSHNELVAKGYAPRSKKDFGFVVPDFCPQEDFMYLPLSVQVKFADYPVGLNGTEQMVHPRRIIKKA